MKIKTVLIDIGGVLLTNGWDGDARSRACKKFGLDEHEVNSRHKLTFDTLEIGKITLEEYLNRVVFYKQQAFSQKAFISFMFQQSRPYADMITLITTLKKKHGFTLIAVSNETREINDYRIKKFKLDSFIDTFISSCYVGLRKPDTAIFKLALDISNSSVDQVIYIEDRPLFVEVAESLGIRSICHTDAASTQKVLTKLCKH